MRFNELSTEKTILDEDRVDEIFDDNAVGLKDRAKNWLKSKTFGKTKDEGQANQLKSAEANRIWRTMHTTIGQDNVDIEDLQAFLIKMGYGRSGKEILKKIAQAKRGAEPKKDEQPTTEPKDTKPADNTSGLETPKPQVQSNYDLQFESVLREAREPIILNKEELKDIIKKVVWRAAATQPKLFSREALRRQGKEGSKFGGDEGETEDRGDNYDDGDSEPTVDYDSNRDEQVEVDKDELIARFERLKKEMAKHDSSKGWSMKDQERAGKAFQDLQDFIDNL